MHLQFHKTLSSFSPQLVRLAGSQIVQTPVNLTCNSSNILNVLTEQSYKNQGVVKKKQHTRSSSSVASVIFCISFFGISRK